MALPKSKKGLIIFILLSEMETMLNNAGLIFKEVYSIPGKKKFTVGEPRAYIIARSKKDFSDFFSES